MANNDGQINVELRLVLDRLRQDIRQAAQAMQAGLTTNMGRVASDTDKAGTAMDRLTAKTRKATAALKEQAQESVRIIDTTQRRASSMSDADWNQWNAQHVAHLQGLQQAAQQAAAPTRRPNPFQFPNAGNGASTPTPTRNTGPRPYGGPVPPLIPPPVIARGGGMTLPGWANLGLLRQMGAGAFYGAGFSAGGMMLGAGARGPQGMAVAGVTQAFYLLRTATQHLIEQFGQASRLYARSMTSGGMPLGVSVRESNLGNVMGVSADTVRQFGSQVQLLNGRLAIANSSMGQTVPILTATTWYYKSLMTTIQSGVMEFGAAMAPSVNSLIQSVHSWTELKIVTNEFALAGALVGAAIKQVADTLRGIQSVAIVATMAITTLFEAIAWFVKQINNLAAKLHIPGFLPANGASFEGTQALMALLKQIWTNPPGGAPNPTASPYQMQGSPWERMGLVIGGGSGASYARDTARYTRQTVETLKQIKDNLLPRGDGLPNAALHPTA